MSNVPWTTSEVAAMVVEIVVLRLIHILGGLFWVGSGLFSTFYLSPALAEAGPAAGAIMGSMQRRRMFVVMPTIASLTILSGLRLMWITSGGFAAAYFKTGGGATFAASGGAAILAFLLGMFVARPAMMRAATLGESMRRAEDAHTRATLAEELQRVQRRSVVLQRAATMLLILAASGMAVARYMY